MSPVKRTESPACHYPAIAAPIIIGTMNLFSDEVRRNPWPAYNQLRAASPLLRVPPPFDAWMVFDYDSVKRVLSDHETFSSGGPMPRNWFIFYGPPRHTKLRALISRAFTPRMIAGLEVRIRELSAELLDKTKDRNEMDLTREYAVPLAMMAIAGMIGIQPRGRASARRNRLCQPGSAPVQRL
jgi:cytochrome P450